mgnify:CR=1 FL=1
MFQIWASKQVLGITGTNEMQARYTANHDKKCPSCGVCVETCGHVLACEEAGRVDLLHQSIISQSKGDDELTKSRVKSTMQKIEQKAAYRIHSMRRDSGLVFPSKSLDMSNMAGGGRGGTLMQK